MFGKYYPSCLTWKDKALVLGKEVVKLPKKTPLGKINSNLNSRDIAKVVSLS